MLYNNLSSYLKSKYGKRLKKICIDGGFSCPNRDGVCGVGGCIYCGERGAGEHISAALSIEEQVKPVIDSADDDSLFIAYFQNFTNTYAPVEILKQRYDRALIDERIRILSIGTRPDCISPEVCALIASYLDRVDVWVELGLQTSSDEIGSIINRGYTTDVYVRACRLLTDYGIPFVTHMIIGLPNQSDTDVFDTVDLINESGSFGIKIHSMYVMKGTALEKMYEQGEYVPISIERYADLCAECISRLRDDMIVHRITGDCPSELLVAPAWNMDKNKVICLIQKILKEKYGRKE